jgi:DNA-binding Lrp family transcriptional regulator
MPMTLDSTDRAILSILQRDARISNADLAQKVHLSPTPCLRRLRRLEKEGWIKQYRAELDTKLLGFEVAAMVFIKLDKNTKSNGEAFERALEDLPQVTECCVVAGAHDYVLRVVTRSLGDYERFLKESLATVEQVADLESLIILNQRLARNALPL